MGTATYVSPNQPPSDRPPPESTPPETRRPETRRPDQRRARVAGALYLATFATSIPTLWLYDAVLNDPDFVLGAGDTGSVRWGAVLEVMLAFACIGTAVALFPLARRHSESAAIGFVSARAVEGSLILVGVVSLLSVVTLREHNTDIGAQEQLSLSTAAQTLVSVHDWSFLLGQSLMPVANAAFLGYVLLRSGLVPRIIPAIGVIGAPLLLVSDGAILFGVYPPGSAPAALAALPIAVWEFALGTWLLAKGVRTPRTVAARVRRGS